MESKIEDTFSWLFGLRSYYMFVNDADKLRIIRNLIALKYGKPEDMHHIIKRVCLEDVEYFTAERQVATRAARYDMYFDFLSKDNAMWSVDRVVNFMALMFGDDKMLRSLNDLIVKFNLDASVRDAFSKGQVTSKVWLTETLQKLINPNNKLENVLIIGGWYGHITKYFKDRIDYGMFYNIDPHEFNGYIGKEFFNNNSDKYVPVGLTTEQVEFQEGQGYRMPLGTFNVDDNFKFNITDYRTVMPDLIINTSCEHMSDQWFHQAPRDKIIALQTNNLFDIAPDHFNCVQKLSDLDAKYPMTKVLFQGELDIGVGKRFMKIGIK
jgi:hypothetical protein